MRIGKTGVCLAICAGLMSAGAWAGEQQHSDIKVHNPTSKQKARDRAWTVNGMQVIKTDPQTRASIYAVTKPDGALAITHTVPNKLTRGDD